MHCNIERNHFSLFVSMQKSAQLYANRRENAASHTSCGFTQTFLPRDSRVNTAVTFVWLPTVHHTPHLTSPLSHPLPLPQRLAAAGRTLRLGPQEGPQQTLPPPGGGRGRCSRTVAPPETCGVHAWQHDTVSSITCTEA